MSVVLVHPEPGVDHAKLINDLLADPSVTKVVLGEGVFTLTAPITIPSNKTLEGAGRDLTVLRADPDNFTRSPLGEEDGLVNSVRGSENVKIFDLSVDASKLAPDGFRLHGVFMREVVGFEIEGVDVYNATGYAQIAQGVLGGEGVTSSGTYTDCYTYNSQVHFEQMASNGITLTDCHARDGDGDIAAEGYFHPLAGSKNITYIDCTGYGYGYSGFNLLSISHVGMVIENIQILNCDIEIFRDDAGSALVALGTLPVINLEIVDSRFVSHGRIAARLGGVEGTAVNSYFQGETLAVQLLNSANGTTPNFAFTDSVALGLRDVAGTAAAFGIGTSGGTLIWNGGSIEARGPIMIPLGGGAIQWTDPPLLITSGWGARLNYQENDAPTRIAPTLSLEGTGLTNFAGGRLLAGFQWRGTATDDLGIASGSGIQVAGDIVSFDGVAIATFVGGDLGEDILFSFNENATQEGVDALIRAITYFSASDDPAQPSRGIEYVVTDAAGASVTLTATVVMTVVNDVPSLALAPLGQAVLDYAENDPATAIAPQATVTDPDFSGGSLMVAFDGNGADGDWLTVADQGNDPGQIGLAGTHVTFGGTVIGEVSGGSHGEALVVTFNAAATVQAVEGLVRAISYINLLDRPALNPRSVSFVLADGDGGISPLATATINLAESDGADDRIVGGEAADNLTGTSTDAEIYGLGGDDRIFGGDGRDWLDGGAGSDAMEGGAGDDTYVIDRWSDQIIESANGGIDRVISSITYTLRANLEYLTLTGSANISAAGNAADNLLVGNAGNNTLDGGAGADIMRGGLGDDTYVVDNAADQVIELAEAGLDRVISSITYTLPGHVEHLTLTGSANISGIGNALVNFLVGNNGDNILDGSAGADAMSGGLGNDTYVIDNPGDQIIESAGGGIDRVISSISYTLRANLEHLTLTGTANISAGGNALANVLIGNSGNNTLDGAAGADVMQGADGNDTYVVDNDGDRVIELADGGMDRVMSSVSYSLGANLEHLVLTGIGNISGAGNSLANFLVGNGGNNTLDGGAGADIMQGGQGNDTYVVDNAGDRVIELADGGMDRVISSVSYTLGANVEHLVLTGTGNISGTGNALANFLVGNDGNNLLDGGAGIDAMQGGQGDDIYVVDTVGDQVIELAGGGTDYVIASVSFALRADVEHLTLVGTAAIDGFGNVLANNLIGNGASNRLEGGGEADRLTGGGGADTFVYRSVNDSTSTARDVIQDFADGDLIDLSLIDAVASTQTNDAFAFVGAAAFSGKAGELRAFNAGSVWIVEGDSDGNGVADLVIEVLVTDGTPLAATDFLL